MQSVRRSVLRSDTTKITVGLSILFLFTLTFTIFFNRNITNANPMTSDFVANVSEILELRLSTCNSEDNSQVIVDIEPSTAGTFKSNCQEVLVNTNAPGYTLTAKATGSKPNYQSGATTNAMLYQNPTTITPHPAIISTSNSIANPQALTNDTWGFAVKGLNPIDTPSNEASTTPNFDTTYTIENPNGTYANLPTSDTAIYSINTFPIPVIDHTFYYAARLTPNTMAGAYTTTITYTAIGEPLPVPQSYPKVGNGIFFQETTLEESESCSALPIYPAAGSTVIMTDSRNNQQYRVRRLQDGKCWMIDNLKLATPGTALTLTSADTNIAEDQTFTIPANAITSSSDRRTNGICIGSTASGSTGNLTCNGTTTQSETNNKFVAYINPGNTSSCRNNTTTNDDPNAYSLDSQSGCGYFYNWYTATAGTGTYSMSTGDTTSSICPIGWRLPSAGTGTADINNEFAVLNGAMIGTGPSITDDITTQPNWHPDGPFSGAYAGNFSSTFYNQGNIGYSWSASAGSTTNAYYSAFNYNYINPGVLNYTKLYAYPVRCVI